VIGLFCLICWFYAIFMVTSCNVLMFFFFFFCRSNDDDEEEEEDNDDDEDSDDDYSKRCLPRGRAASV